jgi:G3E family GTPase
MNAPIPVTLVTGFLGSGKTTLLNRILCELHGEKIAVVENEFGEVGIDNELLLTSDEQIVEMANGCICCTVRGDLVRILGELAEKRRSGRLAFDRVLIETTGLANPAPVAQTFFLDADVARDYRLDAVLTLVDAVHAMRQLDEHELAQQQVGFADRLLISKGDLVDAAHVGRLSARLAQINARAPIEHVDCRDIPLARLIDIGGFKLDAVLEFAPGFLAGAHTHAHAKHTDRISSYAFRTSRDFDGQRLQDFLGDVIRLFGADLLRYKGVLSIAGKPRRVVVQGVHELLGSSVGEPWPADAARQSAFVFIGRDLPREIIAQGLEKCLV